VIARFGVFTFDGRRRQVLGAGGVELHLTRKAFDLLAVLIETAPRVVPKSELHDRLWPGTFVSDAALAALVKELRRVLRDRDSQSALIRTSHGVGYAFCGVLEAPDRQVPVAAHWVIARDRRIALQEGDNLVGRDPLAAVCLNAAGVSRRHARIVVRGREAAIEDLGSKNGTARRGEPVTGPTSLRDGDGLAIGPIKIVYRTSDAGVSTATALSTSS
jgi:DNA-binding winged helix-turn-helix (wHTH) protein